MEIQKLEALAQELYGQTIYMLDYDLAGLFFDKETKGDALFVYLVRMKENIVQTLNENEFKVLVEAFKKELKTLYARQEEEEQKEIAKLIQWVDEEFTYENIYNNKGI